MKNRHIILNQRRVREIMGRNFFGTKEAIKYFRVNPTRAQLDILAEISFSEAVLEKCSDTHIFVDFLPISILGIRRKVERGLFEGYENNYRNQKYSELTFAKDRGKACQYLIKKTPADNSIDITRPGGMSWREHQTLPNDDEEIPIARTMVYTIIGYYLMTGERLFRDAYVRCLLGDSSGRSARVGLFRGPWVGGGMQSPGGLSIGLGYDCFRLSYVGLALERKHRIWLGPFDNIKYTQAGIQIKRRKNETLCFDGHSW